MSDRIEMLYLHHPTLDKVNAPKEQYFGFSRLRDLFKSDVSKGPVC